MDRKTYDEMVASGGGVRALGRTLGITGAAVCQWQHGKIPLGRIRAIEKLTGIRREQLRPDVYAP